MGGVGVTLMSSQMQDLNVEKVSDVAMDDGGE